MANKELMERVFQMIRDANFEMAECRNLSDLLFRWNPPEPLADPEDMRIDSEARPLQTEEDHTSSSLGADARVLCQLQHRFFLGERMDMV